MMSLYNISEMQLILLPCICNAHCS